MSQVKHEENLTFWRRFAGWYDRFIVRAVPEYAAFVDRIAEDATPAGRVLEVAAGTANIAIALARKAEQVEAVDYAPEMIEIARKKADAQHLTNLHLTVQNLCSLDFEDGVFDTVVCSNVLHLLVDPTTALAETHRVLKPRGILIAPTFCHAETPLAMVLGSTMRLAGFKAYHRWTLDAFRRFVEASRYEVIRDDVIGGAIPMCYLIGRKVG